VVQGENKMRVSKDVEELLKAKSEWKEHKLYESLADFSERILPVSPGKSLEKRYQDAIDFCHLNATPKGVFSFTIILPFIILLLSFTMMFLFNSFSLFLMFFVLLFAGGVFFYFYNYPFHLATSFRIKASSEMVLAVIYMTIAMKVRPNLEHAVKYAATNLKGPLSVDLRRLLWDVYVGNFVSVGDALDSFGEKWKRENEEFTESLSIIKTAFNESSERMDKMFGEAVNCMLDGTKDRMKSYARGLRTPVTVINALGFLLPIIGLMFLPLLAVFLTESFKPTFLAIGYCVILPGIVYWVMTTSLQKRPYTFHQPDVSKHLKFRKEKQTGLIIISILIPLLIIGASYYFLSKPATGLAEKFSFSQLMFSLLITIGVAAGIIIYCIFSTIKKIKTREEIVQVERELGEVLFLLGNQLNRGIPIENALKEIKPKIKDLKIAGMFDIILNNIKSFGMDFERAVFDEEHGAINYYPSTLIAAVMKAVVEISRSGMRALSNAMISIASYLKDMHGVEENLYEILDEPTSSMEMQSTLLAPISSGVIVALTSIVMKMLVMFGGLVEKFQTGMADQGGLMGVGGSLLGGLINIQDIMPIYVFQLIVGIYMIEVVVMLGSFTSTIKHGEENIVKRNNIGKKLLISTLIYSVVLIFMFLLFNSIISITDLEGLM
jgi:hypothetical protein